MNILNIVSLGRTPKYASRKKTYFVDIDGTMLIASNDWSPTPAVDGMVAWVKNLEKDGHRIILTTARKESHRAITEKALLDAGYCWDQLIMGCTNGERVVVNDGPSSCMWMKRNG